MLSNRRTSGLYLLTKQQTVSADTYGSMDIQARMGYAPHNYYGLIMRKPLQWLVSQRTEELDIKVKCKIL